MNAYTKKSWHALRPPSAQRGIALITSVMLLVLVTLLAISMFKGFGTQEKLAGNTLEKQRSFQAAESALQYGEWSLSGGTAGGTGVVCPDGVINANTPANIRVCTNALANPIDLKWVSKMTYLPTGMEVKEGGGRSEKNKDVFYSQQPLLYMSYIGLGPDAKSQLYEVTAAGFGGLESSVSVVRSTYAVKSKSNPLDNP